MMEERKLVGKMKLKVENVGMLQQAEIELNGITVIAGENNTGKSTIGKILYCIFRAFYHLDEEVQKEREKAILSTFQMYINVVDSIKGDEDKFVNLCKDFVQNRKEYKNNLIKIQDKVRENVNFISSGYIEDDLSMRQIVSKINDYLNVSDEELERFFIKKYLYAEFGDNVINVNDEKEMAQIDLNIQNYNIAFSVDKNNDIVIYRNLSLMKDLVYIDDPFVWDEVNLNTKSKKGFTHRQDLVLKLLNCKEQDTNSLDELVREQRVQNVLKKIDTICKGKVEMTEDKKYYFTSDKFKKNLDICNLSTGVKSVLLLKYLLLNGYIEENGTMILDEPEIHLHPEWQLVFAEVIVLMQKEYNLNILLNTHSPYFLNALEVYAKQYKIENRCKYYVTDVRGQNTIIKDVTNDTEKIYEKLARPLQDLENMEYAENENI